MIKDLNLQINECLKNNSINIDKSKLDSENKRNLKKLVKKNYLKNVSNSLKQTNEIENTNVKDDEIISRLSAFTFDGKLMSENDEINQFNTWLSKLENIDMVPTSMMFIQADKSKILSNR